MKNKQRKRTIQKLWGWICLSVNCLVVALHLSGQYAELWVGGILLSVLTASYGVIKTHLDKAKGDISVAAIAIEYACVYIITFLLGLKAASSLASVSVLIVLAIVSLAEMLIFIFITYWRAICRFFCHTKT